LDRRIFSGRTARGGPDSVSRESGGLRGWSLVELAIAAGTMVLPIFAAAALLTRSFAVARGNRDTGLALAAASATLERMQNGDIEFEDLFRQFNADPSDDEGAPTAPGPDFAAPGLTPRSGDPDGRPGRIEFPSPTGSPGVLREDLTAALFGLDADQDLNGDGLVDEGDHAEDYRLLPVILHVEWTGSSGERDLVLRTFVTER